MNQLFYNLSFRTPWVFHLYRRYRYVLNLLQLQWSCFWILSLVGIHQILGSTSLLMCFIIISYSATVGSHLVVCRITPKCISRRELKQTRLSPSVSITIQHKVHFSYMLIVLYHLKIKKNVRFIVVNKSSTMLNWSSIADKSDRIEKSAPVRESASLWILLISRLIICRLGKRTFEINCLFIYSWWKLFYPYTESLTIWRFLFIRMLKPPQFVIYELTCECDIMFINGGFWIYGTDVIRL